VVYYTKEDFNTFTRLVVESQQSKNSINYFLHRGENEETAVGTVGCFMPV